MQRPKATQCCRGHDLTVPGARYPSGGCKRCQVLRAQKKVKPRTKAAKGSKKRGESPDHVAAAINRRLLEIADEMDTAPSFRARELKNEMAQLVRRKDAILAKGAACGS